MPSPYIPQTSAQLTTSITLYALGADVNINNLTSASAIAALKNATKLGAVESFTETLTRRTVPRYQIDADIAGDIVERIPELVERTLRVSRIVLYTSDAIQAMGFTSAYDIIQQNVPFALAKVENPPVNSGLQPVTTIYTGVWFHELPKVYNMGADLKVMQDFELGFTQKIVA
jgi:hypothetical protein